MYSNQTAEPKRAKQADDHCLLDLLQKKIKKEPDVKSYIDTPTQPTYNQNYALNPALYTSMVQVPTKIEVPTPTGVYFPMYSQNQGIQTIQQPLHTSMPEPTPTMNLSNMSLAQLINLRNQNNMANAAKSMETVESNQSNENSIKEFQSKLLNLVLSQNKLLLDLKEKNDLLQDSLSVLVGEISAIKK